MVKDLEVLLRKELDNKAKENQDNCRGNKRGELVYEGFVKCLSRKPCASEVYFLTKKYCGYKTLLDYLKRD